MATLGAGCGNNNSETEDPIPTPSTNRVTEGFTGTLAQGATNVHPFSATAPGQVDATLVNVAPLATMAIGVGLGTWDGTTCTAVIQNDNTKAGTVVTGSAARAVNLCLRVYDSGNITEGTTISYTVSVVHP
jgi:flavin-dependent dehydrogenase